MFVPCNLNIVVIFCLHWGGVIFMNASFVMLVYVIFILLFVLLTFGTPLIVVLVILRLTRQEKRKNDIEQQRVDLLEKTHDFQ